MESWTTTLSLTEGQEAACQRKNTMDKKKELLTPGDACRKEMLKTMMMMMSENQSSQSQVLVTAFRCTEG
jgi:hypothetical protein